jgi:hypothetical protein
VHLPVTISESAIAGNSAPFLVDGSSESCSITFSECHFDSFSQNATVANFSMVNCATDAADFPGLPAACLSRTRSRTPPLSARPSAPLDPTRSLPRTAVLRFSSPILLSPPGFGSGKLGGGFALSSLANSNSPSQSVNFVCYRSDVFFALFSSAKIGGIYRNPGRFRSLYSGEFESAISISQFCLLSLGRFFGLFSSA